ncbi:MAG TPA: hypothetical protein VGM41_16600 [Chitinophagaceae bacterium]
MNESESTHKHHLELFMYRIWQMREAQKIYFKDRTNENLRNSLGLEAQVDNALKKLQIMGYSMEEIKKAEQQKMF